MTHSRLLALVVAVALGSASLAAQDPASPPPPPATPSTPAPAAAQPAAPEQPAVQPALPLDGPMALVFHTVKADQSASFEQLFTRLHSGLAGSTSDVRRQQAAGWRLVKQNAPTAEGHLIYVSVIEPVVPGQEYDMARLLAEIYPDEGPVLYQSLLAAHVQPTVQASNLTAVAAAGGQP